jgi:hypothetical protein
MILGELFGAHSCNPSGEPGDGLEADCSGGFGAAHEKASLLGQDLLDALDSNEQ